MFYKSTQGHISVSPISDVGNVHHLLHSQIHATVMSESGASDPVYQGFNVKSILQTASQAGCFWIINQA